MKKQLVVIGIVILLLAVGLSGCEGVDNRFVGTWFHNVKYPKYTFNEDKTYSITGINGTWDIKDGKLVLKHDSITEIYDFNFSMDNTRLTLTGVSEGIARDYYKQP
jgi:hypothetical protein